MTEEPLHEEEYAPRQVEAVNRVLRDVMQVLASFHDCIVLVGGMVPSIALGEEGREHVGSIDIDLALDVTKLTDGRYAEMIELLIKTRRYRSGEKEFQMVTTVDLEDGLPPVQVEIDFLAPKTPPTKRGRKKLVENFRVLKADACEAAFREPSNIKLEGPMINGALNTVRLQVITIAGLLIMKAHALSGRDKPKDAYDICYCLDHYPEGIESLAAAWNNRINDADIRKAIGILEEKFRTVASYGPQQVVMFHNVPDRMEREQQARRSYELVRRFLDLIEQ